MQDINNSFRCLQHSKYFKILFTGIFLSNLIIVNRLNVPCFCFFLFINLNQYYCAISIESREHSMLSDDRKFKVIYQRIPLHMIISLLGCMQCNHHVTETPLMIGSMKNGRYFIGDGMWCNWSIFFENTGKMAYVTSKRPIGFSTPYELLIRTWSFPMEDSCS